MNPASRLWALLLILPTALPAVFIEAEDPRVEARAAVWSNRKWVWALPGTNEWTRKALVNRPEARGGTLVSSGYGFGNLGGGAGDSGFSGLPVKPVLRLPFSNASAVWIHLLFHEQGHTARAVLWQGTRLVTNLAIETWAPFSLSWNDPGVLGTVRGVRVPVTLDPSLPYVLDVSNTGSLPRAAQATAKLLVETKAERAMGRGPQLLVDGFELVGPPSASLDLVCADEAGLPLGQGTVRLLLSNQKPRLATLDGLGRTAFPALEPAVHRLEVEPWPGRTTAVTVDLTAGTNTFLAVTADPVFEIVRPRTAVAFVGDPVGTFTIEVEAPERATEFEARLITRERTLTLPLITRPVYSVGAVFGESRAGWLLQFPLRLIRPPADLWDLEVEAMVDGKRLVRRSPRAVKILPRADEGFSIFHVGDLRLTEASNRLRAKTLLETLSLTGCRFVVLGGDLGLRPGWAPDSRQVAGFFEQGDFPALVTLPGELDVSPVSNGAPSNAMLSRAWWLRAVGTPFHEMRWPGTFFLFHDSLSDPARYTLPAWRRSQRDSRDHVRVLFSHDDLWRPASNEAPKLDLHLTSHGRTNRVLPPPPWPVITTPPVDGAGTLGARLMAFAPEVDLRWRLAAPPGASDKRGVFVRLVAPDPRLPGGRPLLTRTLALPNDGTMASNQVTFRNDTAIGFPEAPVRFILRPGSYQTVGPAEILSAYESEDRNHTVLCLRVRVAPSGVTRAGVSPL